MKTRVHILFLTFLLYTVTLNAQRLIQIDTISVNYFNGITKKNEIIDNYQITNNSDEDYLTWVSLVPINNRTNIELIHDYFKVGGRYLLTDIKAKIKQIYEECGVEPQERVTAQTLHKYFNCARTTIKGKEGLLITSRLY